jgi:tetratricopeptide repeat protein
LDDLPVMGMSLVILPWDYRVKDDLAVVQRNAEECVAIWRKCGDDWFLSWALSGLAYVAYLQHDVEQALALYEDSATLLRRLHEKALLAGILRQLAFIALDKNELQRANGLTQESLQLNVDTREWQGVAGCVVCMAVIALALADDERAANLFGAAQNMTHSFGFVLKLQDQQVFEQGVASLKQRVDAGTFAKAWAAGRALTREQAVALALEVS